MPKSVIRTSPSSVDEDVRRLEIAMQDALRVGSREPVAELLTDVDHLFGRQPAHPANQRGEVFAMDQLHGVEDFASSFADIEHPADRGMRNLAGEPHFIEDEPSAPRGRPSKSA